MGRPKKSVPAPAEIEPEEISQEEPEEEPVAEEEPEDDEPEAGGKAISKAAAVRDALEQGEDGPEDGVAYIKKIHGIEMTRQMFSSYKAQEKARQAKKAEGSVAPAEAPAPRQPRQATAPVTQREFTATPSTASLGGIIEDIDDIKRMLATHGEDGLKKLIDHLK